MQSPRTLGTQVQSIIMHTIQCYLHMHARTHGACYMYVCRSTCHMFNNYLKTVSMQKMLGSECSWLTPPLWSGVKELSSSVQSLHCSTISSAYSVVSWCSAPCSRSREELGKPRTKLSTHSSTMDQETQASRLYGERMHPLIYIMAPDWCKLRQETKGRTRRSGLTALALQGWGWEQW
jgi:hypothetical protein